MKCSGVLHFSDGLSNKVANIIRRLLDNMKLLLLCILRVLLSYSFIFFTYLLTPWSRVLLEKLTSKLCS